MNISAINREWKFITKEINAASNEGGSEKGTMLFEFQILLSALSRTNNLREKQMLALIYQERKERYKNLIKNDSDFVKNCDYTH